MTAREVYEAILIEINKTDTPDILLEDFNYLFNKAINQYVNKSYNKYDINQQATDDLRVLKATSLLNPIKCRAYGGLTSIGRMMGATYEVILPQDYLHILNCICIYEVRKTTKCYNKGDVWRRQAEKLTADKYSQVLDNMWLKPTYRRPYYYIHNVNIENRIIQPTDPIRDWNSYREGNNGRFYVGLIEPTLENYQDLLNGEFGTNQLNNVIFNTMDYAGESSYVYFMVPEGSTLSVLDGNNIDSPFVVVTELINSFDGYDIYKSNGFVNGKIKIFATGGTEEEITGNGLIRIGTDFQEGGLSNLYHNREIDESGVEMDLGKDAFGNVIHVVKEDKGVPHGMNINLGNGQYGKTSLVERSAQVRYGNASQVRMEIRYGTDDSVFKLSKVYIDYIKAPQHIRLTQEQLDLTEDTSQMLEFPDYVCQEIINELVHLIMENTVNQRLSTHPVVSQSIANPTQQQAPQQGQ